MIVIDGNRINMRTIVDYIISKFIRCGHIITILKLTSLQKKEMTSKDGVKKTMCGSHKKCIKAVFIENCFLKVLKFYKF